MNAGTKPGWVTTTGVLGVVFGCFGLLGSVQSLFLDRFLEHQRRMIERVADQPGPGAEFVRRMLETLVDLPQWFRTFSVGAALAGLAIYALYITASVRILKTRPGAVLWFGWASAIVIANALIQAAAAWEALPGLRLFMLPGLVINLLVYITLLAITLAGDRSVFEPDRTTPPPVPPQAG